jgi:hypothetical protein
MKIGDVIKSWLLFDLILTVFLFITIGSEGLAALACEVIDHENCDLLP